MEIPDEKVWPYGKPLPLQTAHQNCDHLVQSTWHAHCLCERGTDLHRDH
jgi:hypothetical protein